MTIHLPEDVERSIAAAVHSGDFPSADDAVAAAWRAFAPLKQAIVTSTADQPAAARRNGTPAWQRVLDNMQAVPDDVFERIPADSSEQLDHYLYGTPKRPTK